MQELCPRRVVVNKVGLRQKRWEKNRSWSPQVDGCRSVDGHREEEQGWCRDDVAVCPHDKAGIADIAFQLAWH